MVNAAGTHVGAVEVEQFFCSKLTSQTIDVVNNFNLITTLCFLVSHCVFLDLSIEQRWDPRCAVSTKYEFVLNYISCIYRVVFPLTSK